MNDFWNGIKELPSNERHTEATEKIRELRAVLIKRKPLITKFFSAAGSSKTQTSSGSGPTTTTQQNMQRADDPPEIVAEEILDTDEGTNDSVSSSSSGAARMYQSPAQDQAKRQLAIISKDIEALLCRREENFVYTAADDKKLGELRQQRDKVKQTLKTLQIKQKSAQNIRSQKRQLDEESGIERRAPGRPGMLEKHPDLLDKINAIAGGTAAAHQRRRTENVRTPSTLRELNSSLRREGIEMGLTTTYYYTEARNRRTNEARRHNKAAPVRFLRATNDLHKSHIDWNFARCSIEHCRELASMLGSEDVAVISQDDKCRVKVGLPAVNKQVPILTATNNRVRFADHDFPVGPKHKLIPSVYAALTIEPGTSGDPKLVTNSGPTYVAIRSAVHSSSTAYSHSLDFSRLYSLKEFEKTMLTKDLQAKPVAMIFTDGGPDENPRFKKTIAAAIDHFLTHDLDFLVVVTNAPERSAFNPVERRMAPLTKRMAGVLLPHNFHGNHLDKNYKTIDEALERRNMFYAADLLKTNFDGMQIDNHPVITEVILPESSEADHEQFREVSEAWKARHVRTSQYCLQISKCDDRRCCPERRSQWDTVFPNRQFLPPPIAVKRDDDGKLFKTDDKDCDFLRLYQSIAHDKGQPYDTNCPKIKPEIKKRTCKKCKQYFASATLLTAHK